MAKKSTPKESPDTGHDKSVFVPDLSKITGTDNPHVHSRLIAQIVEATHMDDGMTEVEKIETGLAALAILERIGPRDELEGLLAAQYFMAHNAAADCLRRAAAPDQPAECRDANLKMGASLMRLCLEQLKTFDERRGMGQQKIVVERVDVQAGGQAVVGNVATGAKDRPKSESPPAAKNDPHTDTPARRLEPPDQTSMVSMTWLGEQIENFKNESQ